MKKKYISPELELISLSLTKDVLGASTNPTDVPENPGSGGNEGIEGDL
ncbi:hypothetical protein [Ruminococcus sp.]